MKAPLYAGQGVPELWIVDLAARKVEVHRRLRAAATRPSLASGPAARSSPGALPRVSLAATTVLG